MYSKRAKPNDGTFVSFQNHNRQTKLPFIIYAHIESLRVPQGENYLHKPCGFAYSVKSIDNSVVKYDKYVGEDSARVLWTKLEAEVREITQSLKAKKARRPLNSDEKVHAKKIKECHFCRKELQDDRNEAFHPYTGDFLGVAHRKCINFKLDFVPVVMHNLAKYGSHFLLKELTPEEMKSVFIVGDNQGFQRKYSNNCVVRFLDLRQFMDESIDDLEKILSDSKKKKIKTEFPEAELFKIMKKRACFPTYFMDSFTKFDHRSFPDRSGFFDTLHEEELSKKDYKRSKQIWSSFGCSTLRDYFYWYLKSNVCLLEDIFENFRVLCLRNYGLDPAHYYTIAGFSWDSMLRYTGVQLEMLQDQSMIKFIKDNIRGGILQCSKRHSKANNKYCSYDKTKPSSFIVYLDANNLGGWAMSQNLPFSNFRWLTQPEIRTITNGIHSLDENGKCGYIFEVDLDYPEDLHDDHNDLPFCSNHILHFSEKKPALTLTDKKKYVIEYRTLKQCLEHGLILRKVHRILKFDQCKWLEPYVRYNTDLRVQAKNDFEVKLFKLLNNSVYGKTIQRTSTDKPIYAGFSILELSKKFMYDFHYNQMVQIYPNLNLLYIDTDGAIYEIFTDDYYQDLKNNPKLLELLDTSNLDSRWGIPQMNKKAVGKMKEEYGGRIIREFFGVGAKVYFLDVDGEEVKKAVGMKKYVKQKFISRSDYEMCVFGKKKITRCFYETSTEDHVVRSEKKTKVVLSPGDWKRCVMDDDVNTLAWRMYKLPM